MDTVTFKSVLDKISGYLGENDGMDTDDAGLATRLINTRLRGAWEFFFWPELMPVEQRQFRPNWTSVLAVTAGTQLYYVPAKKYYQALQASTNQPPGTVTNGSCVLNAAYWAECAPNYCGNDWQPNTVYNLGDIRRNPADNLFYQCFVPHTSGAALDATKFGALIPFVRSLAYSQPGLTPFGEIKKIYARDPEIYPDPPQIKFNRKQNYLVVWGWEPVVWVEYRLKPNQFTLMPWDDSGNVPGDLRYYDATGECYLALNTTTNVPTNTTDWVKVDFPYRFAEYVAQSVYAALVSREEEVPEDFQIELSAGFPLLQAELMKIERQEGQARQLSVVNCQSSY